MGRTFTRQEGMSEESGHGMTGRKQPEPTDQGGWRDVLEAARKGNSQALGKLLKECEAEVGGGIGRQIPNHLRDAFDETDVMQITFTDAILDIHKFLSSTPASFTAWVRRIAEHNLRDACDALDSRKRPPRKRRVAVGLPGDSYTRFLEQLSGSATTPSGHFTASEIKVKVDAAFEALSPDYRRVIQLHDFEGRAFREVASIMKRSLGFVHMAHARALDRMREFLGASTNFFSS